MGTNNSRENSNMSGSDQENDSSNLSFLSRISGDGDEETDLPSIVAFLIRSGQIRFISNDAGMGDSDSDASSDDNEYADFVTRCKPALVDKNPDTSAIKKSDIHAAVMRSSGRSSNSHWTYYYRPSFLNRIAKREVGLNQQKHFTHGDKCVLSSKFLPNKMKVLASYNHKAFCGSYSSDGDLFVTACQDQMIRVYLTKDDRFKLIKSIRAKDVGWSILDTAFSPDGRYTAYTSWSDCIHLCNLFGDHDIHQALPLVPGDYSFAIFSLKFSSDNKEILGGANDGHLYVYDRDVNKRTLKAIAFRYLLNSLGQPVRRIRTSKLTRSFAAYSQIDAHEGDVNTVCFADDSSQILYSGGDDGLCKVWDRRTLREENPVPVGTLAGHSDGITYIDSKGDARFFISNSKDQTMKLWDVRHFSDQIGIEATKRAVSLQRWDYRWQQVPKKVSRKTVLKGDSALMTYRGHRILNTLIRCKFSPPENTGQRYLYTGCASGSVMVYDMLTGEMVCRLDGHSSAVRDVSWHPYDNTIMTASWDGTIGHWYYSQQEESDSSTNASGEHPRKKRLRSWLR